MRGRLGKLSIFIGFVLGFLILVSGVSGATNVGSCQVINQSGTYVLSQSITNGSVTGCINITASDVILDGAGYNINGTRTYGTYGVYVYNSSIALTNVTVKNLNVTNWYYGIEYNNTQNGSIENNTANSNSYYGIYLSFSSSNTLSNNTALHNLRGIYLKHSSNNYLTNNTVSHNIFSGIYLSSSSSNNTLRNNTASNNGDGIYLVYSSNNNITNNTANSNTRGIYLSSSSNNTLSSNTASSNNQNGIFLLYSSNNHITNNTANLNKYDGIVISSSSNNILTQNTMSNNTYNFYIDGFSISNFVQTIDTSNTVNGKPIYYLVGASNQMINSSTNVGYVGVVNSINVTVSGLTLTNNGEGVLFVNTSNSSVLNVNASNNHYGIYLSFSSSNTLTRNNASNNIVGIDLLYSSNNTITSNNASNNRKNQYGYGAYGIYLSSSSSNTLTSNIALHNRFGIYLNSSSNYNTIASNTANSNYGIYLAYSSNYNTVSNNWGGIWLSSSSNYNTIASNTANSNYGIYLAYSSNNTITNNTASNNTFYGILLSSSNNNTITSNTALHNNLRGIYLEHSSNNYMSNNTVNSNNGDGISLVYSSNNTLTNNIVNSNNYDGIYLQHSNNYNIISGGTINNNGQYGIFIAGTINHGSSYITVTGVQIHNNGPLSSTGAGIYDLVEKGESYQNFSYNNISGSYYGIYLIGEDNSNITGNMVWNNTYGISLQSSSYNTMIRNTMSNNTYNFDINGSSISNFIQTIDISNTVNGKPIYYLVGASNQMINSSTNAGYVGVVNSINVTVSGLTLMNNGQGVLFVNTSSSSVFNVNASNNKVGIPLKYSSNNTLANNTLANNSLDFNSQNSSSNTIITNMFNNTKASFTYSGDIMVNSSSLPASTPSGYESIGKYLNITNTTSAWIYLNVSYNNSDVAHLTESTLKMWDYNGTGWNQVPSPNGVNVSQNYVYANLTIFSVFAPMGNDIIPPSVNLISPTNSTYSTTQIPLNYTSSDINLQTTWYQYKGSNVTLYGNTTLKALNNQESLLILWANDTAGNINLTSVTFTVDTTPPEVTIISPLSITYNTSSVTLNVSRSDNFGINTTLYSVDGAANLTYSAPTTVTGLANGTHNIVVFTNDSAGNVNITSVSFSVDIINESVNNIIANASNNQTNISIPDVFLNISTVLALVGKVNVTVYSATPPSVNTSLSVARYVEINVSDNMNDTSGNLSWVYLSVNYTAQEVSGLDESTLRLYWWNPSAGNWTKLVTGANLTAYGGPYVYSAGVNTVANYVWANLSHFSTYGISGSVPSPTPAISPVSYGGVYTPEVTLLANSIDLSLAGELVNYLKAQGITVHITNAQNFSEYNKWQYVIILGGQNAYNGTGNIVANITGGNDKAEILNSSVYMKKGSVFRSGGVVYLFAGKDRNATRKAWEEHYKEVAKEIEYNWG